MSKRNGDPQPEGGLGKIRDRIARGQNQGERTEQAAFGRVHRAREAGRAARVRARDTRNGGKK